MTQPETAVLCPRSLHCPVVKAPFLSLQVLLFGEGPLMLPLATFAVGSSAMFEYAHPAAMFALAEVKLLASEPPPFQVDAALTRDISAWMLEAAGMVSPALMPKQDPCGCLIPQ